MLRPLTLSALIACLSLTTSLVRADDAARQFTDEVWPMLTARCVQCHGTEEQEGGLRLDTQTAALTGGNHGPAIVPGEPNKSWLLKAVLHDVEDKRLAMPPKEKLSAKEIATLKAWIKAGAAWPETAAKSLSTASQNAGERLGSAWTDKRNPIVTLFRGQRLELWSLKPMQRPALPATIDHEALQPIDYLVRVKLAEHKLAPAAAADRRTLARRLYYDLLGLPPSPEQVKSFVSDERPDAYERLVDELLASPRYGEHMARLWLDVVRYSDSNGFDWDEFRPRVWLFRDYVIRSFNADKPYDQFITEQLAGDELFSGPPRTRAEQDALLATTFLRLGPQDNSAPLFNEQPRARAEWMADVTETTASAFLGLTMSCCRCHDHKFDPLSQADHFRLRAFFEPLEYADDLPIDLASEQEVIRAQQAEIEARVQPLERQRETLLGAARERVQNERRAKLAEDERKLLDIPAEKQSDEQKAKLAELNKSLEVSDDEVRKAWTEDERKQDKTLEQGIRDENGKRPTFAHAWIPRDKSSDVPTTHILYQGDHKAPREAVTAGFISALDPNPAMLVTPTNSQSTGRRLTLARWITSRENPLAARVLVNRLWQHHFGRGLVATPNDFGLAGAKPTHPELLDYLASEFVADGWSIKGLQRRIVTSATYRQSSSASAAALAGDTENLWLARQSLRRLTAEQLRDALLVTAGTLTTKTAGSPIWPELPPEVLQANPAFLDDNSTKTKGWYPSPAAEQDARSVFLVQKKTVRVPFLETFDLPENSTSCARRNASTVAPQAFSLLNSPLAVRLAKSFATRVEEEAGQDPAAQIQRAFAIALQRLPTDRERAACQTLLTKRSLPELCRVLLNVNEFMYID